MRAAVSMPRSPTSTTCRKPTRSRSVATWLATVSGSAVEPSKTLTATGQPSAVHSRPKTICSVLLPPVAAVPALGQRAVAPLPRSWRSGRRAPGCAPAGAAWPGGDVAVGQAANAGERLFGVDERLALQCATHQIDDGSGRWETENEWRRGWDSNPRAGYPTRRFRGAPVTTTSVPLRKNEPGPARQAGTHAPARPSHSSVRRPVVGWQPGRRGIQKSRFKIQYIEQMAPSRRAAFSRERKPGPCNTAETHVRQGRPRPGMHLASPLPLNGNFVNTAVPERRLRLSRSNPANVAAFAVGENVSTNQSRSIS